MSERLSLRVARRRLAYWAARYSAEYDTEIERISAGVRERGYYSQPEFLIACRWKSPRTKRHVESNSADFVEAVTRTALATEHEQLRIEVLTLLRGVSWPMASVLLHFGHRETYPILDYRALWSLGIEEFRYDYPFWSYYTQACRKLTKENRMSMRQLDRALWQYSKENQP